MSNNYVSDNDDCVHLYLPGRVAGCAVQSEPEPMSFALCSGADCEGPGDSAPPAPTYSELDTVPCECGARPAEWRSYGSGRRRYACDSCHAHARTF